MQQIGSSFGLWCLTPLSTRREFFLGKSYFSNFRRGARPLCIRPWRKPEYSEKPPDLSQVTVETLSYINV